MSLFNQIMRKDAPILKKEKFYGASYEDLNNIESPSNEAIRNFQFEKLKQFQAQAFKNEIKTDELNNFLFSTTKGEELNNNFSKEITDALSRINEEIRSMTTKGYSTRSVRNKIEKDAALKNEVEAKLVNICNLLDNFKKSPEEPISSKYIDMLYSYVRGTKKPSISQVLGNLFKIQGDILEEVGVEFFSKKVPQGIRVVNTGNLGVKGNRGQQHISDILTLDLRDSEKIKGIEIEYTIKGKKDSKSLVDFLKYMEEFREEGRIVITDESNKTLTSLSLANIQAKAGKNQLPWNEKSKNTWVNLKPDDKSSPLNSYVDFLERIGNLYADWKDSKSNIKQTSDAYNAMANYILGAQLSKVLHLSQADNQYVLTPKGFMTYTERISELYENFSVKTYPFRFSGGINMSDGKSILNKKRKVVFVGKK